MGGHDPSILDLPKPQIESVQVSVEDQRQPKQIF